MNTKTTKEEKIDRLYINFVNEVVRMWHMRFKIIQEHSISFRSCEKPLHRKTVDIFVFLCSSFIFVDNTINLNRTYANKSKSQSFSRKVI